MRLQGAGKSGEMCATDWGESETPAKVLREDIGVVLIGDCIFNRGTHGILTRTVFLFLSGDGTRCILTFQRRGEEEEDFLKLANKGLVRVEVENAEGLKGKLEGDCASHNGLEICELARPKDPGS